MPDSADTDTDISTDADLNAAIDALGSQTSVPDSLADVQAGSAPRSGVEDSERGLPGGTSAASEVPQSTEVAHAATADEADAPVSSVASSVVSPVASPTVGPGPNAGGPHRKNGGDTAALSRLGDDGQAGDDGVSVRSAPTSGLSVSRDGRERLITILKGTHFSLPRQTQFFVRQVAGQARFTTDSMYDLDNEDQHDWNKLTGITFTPLRPDKNAIMVAWRYNLTTEMFEIGPYYNVDLARIMPTPSEIISVPLGQEFTYALDYNGITLVHGDQTVYKPVPAGLRPRVLTAVRISGWFGGTSVAPRTISYYVNLNNRQPTACRWWCIAERTPRAQGS